MRRSAAIALVAGLTLTCAAAADAFVYWANRDNASIGRAKSNGKGVDQSYVGTGRASTGSRSTTSTSTGPTADRGGIGRATATGRHLKRKF